MSTKTVYLDLSINLTDKAQVDRLANALPLFFSRTAGWVSLANGGGFNGDVFGPPNLMAAKFNAPLIGVGSTPAAPSITSSWITNVNQTTFPTNEASFDVKSGGWFGISWLFGTTTHYIWRGRFAFTPANTPSETGATPEPARAISQRSWIDGFEFPEQGSGGSGAFGAQVSRIASRHVDGYGLAIRGSDGAYLHSVTEFGAAARAGSWERFYLRLVNAPAAATTFWRCRGSVSNTSGVMLKMTPTGRIAVYDVDGSSVETLVAQTDPLNSRIFVRIDLYFAYGAGASFRISINGVAAITASLPIAGGMVGVQNHASSELGGGAGVAANNLGLDVDDWVCAPNPGFGNGLDQRYGSKMVRIEAEDFGLTMANWAGDVRILNKNPEESSDLVGLTSTTSGARLAVTTDDKAINGVLSALGVAAFVVSCYNKRTGAGEGSLGYSIAGNAAVVTPIVQATTVKWNSLMYRPAGMVTPVGITPLELIFDKAANTNNGTVYVLGATVELIGIFGPEDVAPAGTGIVPKTIPGGSGIHNAPYPRTPWANLAGRPESAVILHSGTYTGNDTGQDLTFRTPVHWLFIRHAVSGASGTFWFSSMSGAHRHFGESYDQLGMVNAAIDPNYTAPVSGETDQAQRTRIRIGGDDAAFNALGETYHYVAVCDPGMRFMLNGGVEYFRGAVDRVTNLVNSNFTPRAGFFARENRGGGSTGGAYYKGPGHATSTASSLEAAETASLVNFAKGKITTKSAFHWSSASSTSGIAFNLWRIDDGSGDAGVARVCAIFSYTGDGTGNRNIAITPASERYPLAIFVTPHDAATVYRDGSHTGTNSTRLPTSNLASTGIRGGDVDVIKVGSALNANGVTYDVFCLIGGETGNADGISDDGEFEPVEPIAPVDGPWPPEPTSDPVDPGGEGPETPVLPPADFETACLGASTKAINQALGFLGVSSPVVDITTEVTTEATLARLYFSDDIETVLRDFAWPFATRYRVLELVGGTEAAPVNRDWTFSYRLPTDCEAARRLCSDTGKKRTFDPNPPKFRLGSDTTGPLLFCDIEDPELEYTARLPCPLGAGDAMFRLAFAWKLAASLAPAVARNKITAADCMKQYFFLVNQAEVRAAREEQQEPQGGASWIDDRG